MCDTYSCAIHIHVRYISPKARLKGLSLSLSLSKKKKKKKKNREQIHSL